jgi:hypothetical protein
MALYWLHVAIFQNKSKKVIKTRRNNNIIICNFVADHHVLSSFSYITADITKGSLKKKKARSHPLYHTKP